MPNPAAVLPAPASPPATPANSAHPGVEDGQDDRALLFQGIAHQSQGRLDLAEPIFLDHLSRHPDDPVALYSQAALLMARRDSAAALAMLEHGMRVAGHFAPLAYALGTTLQTLGRREEALAAYDRALALRPDYVEALVNSGTLLRDMLRHAQALERFQQALAVSPQYENALGNCAILLSEFKRNAEATDLFERLVAQNPDYDFALGLLAYERLHVCDWRDFDPLRQRIIDGVRQGKRASKSLGLMALSDSAADHQRCAQLFAQRFAIPTTPLWSGQRYRHQRIRLAYVSPDLREHPVGHLMAGILERHDKTRFETYAISVGVDDGSRLRGRILKSFDHFIDARTMSSRQIAQWMREQEIDVAVDLAGYTSDSRTDVFAWRPAPVQVNYLGYPGTLGTDYMDYILADRHVIPPHHQVHYNEKVVYLPDAYLPTDGGIQIAERTPTRGECGLPEHGVVFCSFNHDYKISPHVFAVWMRLLQRVPGSVLWLMSRNEASQRNLRQAAIDRGVDANRLVFASRVPRVEDHLARYRQADLFLDTHPYNAHTTAADALMAGLPVVTYMGEAFPARVAGSLLNAAGLPELITHTLEDYEALAFALATQPQRLQAIKAKLGQGRQASALFDTAGFCRNLEACYVAMWRNAQLDGAHDALSVNP